MRDSYGRGCFAYNDNEGRDSFISLILARVNITQPLFFPGDNNANGIGIYNFTTIKGK